MVYLGLPWWLSGKESTCRCRRLEFDPWVGKTPGEGNGDPLQYSCLENPMDRRAWRLQRAGHHRSDLAHIEFVTILFLFYVLVFLLPGMWDLSSLTSDWTLTPCTGRQSLNQGTTREAPKNPFINVHLDEFWQIKRLVKWIPQPNHRVCASPPKVPLGLFAASLPPPPPTPPGQWLIYFLSL